MINLASIAAATLLTLPLPAAAAGRSATTQPPTAAVQRVADASARLPATVDGHRVLGEMTLTATAYGPSAQDNYPYGASDYFGNPLVPGDVAVDPSVIPLGTYLYVTGYSSDVLPRGGFLAQAMDEGDAIQGRRLDIFMDASEATVSNFGVQQVTAYILAR